MENLLPLVLSGVASLVIGAVYYHPKVFGTMWMHSAGLTEEKLKGGNMVVIFGVAFLMAMIFAMFMNFTMETHVTQNPHFEPKSGPFGHGVIHGIFTFVFVAMPIIVTISLFERRNFKYILSHALYWLITFAVIGGIVTAL